MAFHQSSEYSPLQHSHAEYNKLQFSYEIARQTQTQFLVDQYNAQYNPTDLERDHPNSLSIGNLYVNGMLSTVYVPYAWVQAADTINWSIFRPIFGAIKLVALKTKKKISLADVVDDNFDGWLWLDGDTSYPLSVFRLSNDIKNADFVDIENSSDADIDKTFKTKAILNFISADNITTPFTGYEARNVLINHRHAIKLNGEYNISSISQIKVTKDSPGENPGNSIHIGSGYTLDIDKRLEKITPKTKKADGITYTLSAASKKISDKTFYALSTIGYISQNGEYLPNGPSWRDIWQVSAQNRAKFSINDVALTCNISASTGDIINNSSIAGQTYPSHNLIPFMVYVGSKQEIYQ